MAIVGIEIDAMDENGSWRQIIPRGLQFSQWTIASIPGHPLLARVANRSLARIRESTLQELLNADSLEVQELTGPAIWTDSVYIHLHDLGSRDPRREFKHMAKPNHVGGNDPNHANDNLMILPITAFNPTCYSMKAKGPCDALAMVMHRFEGTWRSITGAGGSVGRSYTPPVIDNRRVHLMAGDIVAAWSPITSKYDSLGYAFYEVAKSITLGKYSTFQPLYVYLLDEGPQTGVYWRKIAAEETPLCQDRLLVNRRGLMYIIDDALSVKEQVCYQ